MLTFYFRHFSSRFPLCIRVHSTERHRATSALHDACKTVPKRSLIRTASCTRWHCEQLWCALLGRWHQPCGTPALVGRDTGLKTLMQDQISCKYWKSLDLCTHPNKHGICDEALYSTAVLFVGLLFRFHFSLGECIEFGAACLSKQSARRQPLISAGGALARKGGFMKTPGL